MPITITATNHEKEVKQSTKPVIIDIYAPWCGPCQQMEPILEDLEKELSQKYTFAKLNVDDNRELCTKEYGVTSIPTIILIQNGKIISKEVGYLDEETLREKIESAFGKK